MTNKNDDKQPTLWRPSPEAALDGAKTINAATTACLAAGLDDGAILATMAVLLADYCVALCLSRVDFEAFMGAEYDSARRAMGDFRPKSPMPRFVADVNPVAVAVLVPALMHLDAAYKSRVTSHVLGAQIALAWAGFIDRATFVSRMGERYDHALAGRMAREREAN